MHVLSSQPTAKRTRTRIGHWLPVGNVSQPRPVSGPRLTPVGLRAGTGRGLQSRCCGVADVAANSRHSVPAVQHIPGTIPRGRHQMPIGCIRDVDVLMTKPLSKICDRDSVSQHHGREHVPQSEPFSSSSHDEQPQGLAAPLPGGVRTNVSGGKRKFSGRLSEVGGSSEPLPSDSARPAFAADSSRGR